MGESTNTLSLPDCERRLRYYLAAMIWLHPQIVGQAWSFCVLKYTLLGVLSQRWGKWLRPPTFPPPLFCHWTEAELMGTPNFTPLPLSPVPYWPEHADLTNFNQWPAVTITSCLVWVRVASVSVVMGELWPTRVTSCCPVSRSIYREQESSQTDLLGDQVQSHWLSVTWLSGGGGGDRYSSKLLPSAIWFIKFP